jgi:hypothetical protein
LPTLVFLGGTMPGALMGWAWNNRLHRIAFVGCVVIATFILLLFPPARRVAGEQTDLHLMNLGWWCLLLIVGLWVSMFALIQPLLQRQRCESRNRESRDGLFLSSWFWITLVLGAFASPFLAVRRVVEASLPGWIMLLCGRRDQVAPSRIGVWLTLVFNTLLGFLVAAADYELASVYRKFATDLADIVGPRPSRVWCYGYWGWFHYPRATHLPSYVVGRDIPPAGSLLVIPDEAARPANLPDALAHRLQQKHKRYITGRIPLRVMHYQSGAGYYSDSWGPLPYTWSQMPLEVFHFYEVGDPMETRPRARTADQSAIPEN